MRCTVRPVTCLIGGRRFPLEDFLSPRCFPSAAGVGYEPATGLQFLSSLIVKVILAIFSWASAQRLHGPLPHCQGLCCEFHAWSRRAPTETRTLHPATRWRCIGDAMPTQGQQRDARTHRAHADVTNDCHVLPILKTRRHLPSCKLTWLALGNDPAACSCRVEQFTAL